MATLDPFDIRNYEQVGPGRSTIDPDTLAQANRARRVELYGEESVRRMERAGQTFRGSTNPAVDGRSPRVAGAGAGGTTPPPRSGAGITPSSARPPRPTSRLLRFGAKTSGIGALALAGLDTLNDTTAEREAFMRKLGLEEKNDAGKGTGYFSDSSRLAGGAAAFLNSLALGVPERLIDKFQGRGFFRPDEPVAPATAGVEAQPSTGVTATAQAKPVTGGPTRGVTRVTSPEELAAINDYIDSGAGRPDPGTGVFRNNETGAAYQLNFGGPRGVEDGSAQPRSRTQFSTGMPYVDEALRLAFEQFPERVARSKKRDETAATAAQAALLKALTDANKPEATKVIDPLLPGQPPRAVQVRGGVASELPISKPLPPGETAASMATRARNDVQSGKTTVEGALAALREFGISLDKL